MIISRSPLRLPIFGGATDLKSYYSKFGGFFISAAIQKYVYTAINNTYNDEYILKYSKTEKVKNIQDIKHPIIREALLLTKVIDPGIEITSMADIPAGSGMGSSSSFATALLKMLYKYKKHFISPVDLAKLACHIEIDLLKEPIGVQDQYISACGGINVFSIDTEGTVDIKPLNISSDTLEQLEENLIMFPTGFYRAASKVLKEQDDKSKSMDAEMLGNLHYVKDLAYRGLEHLEKGNLTDFGLLMHEHWMHKKKRSSTMSNSDIDKWYELALQNGAIGGKVAGAGSGGFIVLYVENKNKLIKAFADIGLKPLNIKFDFEGTKIL